MVLYGEARFVLDVVRLLVLPNVTIIAVIMVIEVYWLMVMGTSHLLLLILSVVHAEVVVLVERRLHTARTTQVIDILTVKRLPLVP